MHANERPCTHVKDPVVHVEFGGLWMEHTKLTSMHLYLRIWNVAAQVLEELETVTYATPPMDSWS